MIQLTEFNNSPPQEIRRDQIRQGFLRTHTNRIERNLRQLGAVEYNMILPETKTLPFVIHPDEQILGIVYGRYKQSDNGEHVSRGALVATNHRLLLINKKPLFVKCEEISYRVINGITYSRVAIAGTVTLHTRMGDISLRTFNQRCAQNFVEAIEAGIFKDRDEENRNDYLT